MKFRVRKQTPDPGRRRPSQTNPAVFSYYARGASPSDQNTGRNKKSGPDTNQSYRLRLGHLPSYVALIAILLAFGKVCLLDSRPKIVLVQTGGTVHREPKTYQDGVQEIWEKSLLNRTKLTVATGKIKNEISNQFSELSDIQIELPLLGSRPTIRITPGAPAIELVSGNGSFYINHEGVALARTAELTKNEIDKLAVIHDDTGVAAEPGKTIIPKPHVTFLRRLHAQLQAENINISSITLPRTAANQVDLKVDGQTYYVKFSLDTDARQAVGSYLAAKAKLDSEGTKPAEYMDVRVPEKVFYK